VLQCVRAVQPNINYFRDIDEAVRAFLSQQSYMPSVISKYCK